MLKLGLALSVGRKLFSDLIGRLLQKLSLRGTYSENLASSRSLITEIANAGILDDATILLTPTSYSDARVHSVKTYTGDELVTNGDFSDLGTGWTTQGDSITFPDGAVRIARTTNTTFIQQNVLTSGNVYKVEFDVLDKVDNNGTFIVRLGSNNVYDVSAYEGTKFSKVITSSGIDFRIYSSSDNGVVYIDNVSVVDVSSDFDFDRASSATRINSDGLVQDMQSITDPELVQNGDFEELGSELVTNGTFDTDSDWSKGGGATISGGTGNIIGDGTSFTSLTQANVFTVGKTYKITVDVTINSGLGLKFQDGSTNENFGFATTSGSYTFYGIANNSSFVIGRRTGGTAFDSTVDNVSIQQVDPNDEWVLGTGWSIEDGVAKSTTSGGSSYLTQSGILTSSNVYKITFTVSNYVSGTVKATVSGQEGSSITANGTYIEYLTTTGTDFSIKSQGGTFNGSIDNISVKDITFSEDVNLARINYDSNGENGHILLEPTSTNLLPYSEDIASWNFITAGVVATSNYGISPDGTQNSTRIVFSDASQQYSHTLTTVSGVTGSIYIKGTSGETIAFGVQNVETVYTLDGSWQRFSEYGTATGNKITINTYGGATARDIQVWGGQMEALPYATSYIPTLTGSTVTRATETLTGSGNSTLINSTEGVLYAEIASLNNTVNSNYISLSDGTYNNRAAILYSTGSNIIRAFLRFNGNVQADMQYLVTDITDYHKVAFKYKANDFALWIDGVEVATDTSGSTLSANTLNALSFSEINTSANAFKGKCKALAVFDRALTDQELIDLTS